MAGCVPLSFPNQDPGVFRSPCSGPRRQLAPHSGPLFRPTPHSAEITAFILPRLCVLLLIRKLPLELKYVSQMNLLSSFPRCDSLVLAVRQSHSEAAYGDINIPAHYKIHAQNCSCVLGASSCGLTRWGGPGSGCPHVEGGQLAPGV